MSDTETEQDIAVSNGYRRRHRTATFNAARAVTNADGRSAQARRMKALIAEFTEQLPPARRNATSALLIRRLVAAILQCESLDDDMAAGEPIDPKLSLQITATISGLLKSLGLIADRKPAKRSVRARAGDDRDEFPEGASDPLVAYCRNLQNGTTAPDSAPDARLGTAPKSDRRVALFDERPAFDPLADQTEPEPLRHVPSLKRTRTTRRRVRLNPED